MEKSVKGTDNFQILIASLYRAPKAKDLRISFFKTLFRSATINPHSLKVSRIDTNKISVQVVLNYVTPDLAALKKKKKLVMIRKTQKVQLTLEPEIHGRVFITHFRNMFMLTLEEVLVLWNLYLIFSDASKTKLFQSLIQEEIKV